MRIFFSFLFWFFVAKSAALAQNEAKSHLVSYNVNTILELELINPSTSELLFEFANVVDFEYGKIVDQASGIKVRSNKAWTVNVKTKTENFSSTTGNQIVSADKLGIRKSGDMNFMPLSITDQLLASGLKGGFNENTFYIDFFAKPGYILPAVYTIELIYTITAP